MRKNYKHQIIDFVTFMLHKNAEIYGYAIDYQADTKTLLRYIKDIFELEMGINTNRYSKTTLRPVFILWANDLDCPISVIDNIDYTDFYTLNALTPKRLHKAENAQVDYINNVIFDLIFGE